MTVPLDQASSIEDWGSYRKLVIDTLRRLDERTLEFHESLSDLHTRVSLIEHNDHSKEIDRLDKEIIELRKDLFRFKTTVDTERASDAGKKQALTVWGGALWAVVSLVAAAVLSGWFQKIFGG